MSISSEAVINQFLRTYPRPFSIKELYAMIVRTGGKMSIADCKDYVESSPFVFELHNNTYVTRAGAFTNKQFSFKPTQYEIEKKMFVPGHRCMPFASPEIVSCFLHFLFLGERLPSKVAEFDSSDAVKFFTLFGEEYASQYIASDPANDSLDLARLDFELPPKVNLTGISLEPLIKSCNFQYGDRILCKVIDWDRGGIEVLPVILHNRNLKINETDVKRQEWYEKLENYILDDFLYMGPCESIEKQLANIFFEYGDFLSCPHCGSVEELLQKSKKIGFEDYGVETRLWHKGEDVPAVGPWDAGADIAEELPAEAWIPSLDFLINTYIKDFLYQKKDDFSSLIETMKLLPLSKADKDTLQHCIDLRGAAILRRYNWFADFVTGAVRHRALKLYQKISSLINDILYHNVKLESFPQQELVIMTQLYSHLMQILESVENSPAYIKEESEAIMLSLEGMELNFDDIKPLLCAAAAEQYKKGFKVIK